ncbi:hypothetical protein [Nocardia brasiliensis]|uniref:hypothetical protein n=1 Tax=Nocardia brasiliensis TaxID=37326 RepID=UPI003D8EAE30
MRRVQQVGEILRFGGVGLDSAIREFAILVVARHWNQAVEWGIHRRIAIEVGVPEEVCAAIGSRRRPGLLPKGFAGAFDVITELLHTTDLGDATFDRAIDELGEQGLVELATLVGYYSTLAMVMNIAHTPPPEGAPPLPPHGGTTWCSS